MNSDCVGQHGEGVLVGPIVTDHDRQRGAILDTIMDPAHRGSLVPVEPGPYLEIHLALDDHQFLVIGRDKQLKDRGHLVDR